GIATGKSASLARLASHGIPTVDADVLAREVVRPGTAGLAAVVDRFGPTIVRPDGALDRPALGRIVFSDPAARADLEAIVHPRVYQTIATWLANLPPGIAAAVADIPLLFETGHQHQFDAVIVCACDPAEQIRRVRQRDNLTEPEAQARVAAQRPIAAQVEPADYELWTDGTFQDTYAQTDAVRNGLVG